MNPNTTRARNTIIKALAKSGVFQFRFSITRDKKGSKRTSNKYLKLAILQLNKEKSLMIIRKRIFCCNIEGNKVSGINYTAIKIFTQLKPKNIHRRTPENKSFNVYLRN